ncbi:MAG: CPBP family intramembrane metalloprotease, partial [Myxococcales bacterium]|nr:CPBP family intramembrane metalloprotease [Myxococcales bacterium]
LGAILPMLVIITVMIGAYYPAIDLTAGEKERGTIQSLYTAPISSLEVVAGKYLAVLVIAIISGAANLLSMGLVFTQNFILGGLSEELDFSFSAVTAAQLFWAILLAAFLFSAVLLAVAVLARSYKEGQHFITPVYLICVLPAAIAQTPGIELTTFSAVIPAINVVLLMKAALLGEGTANLFFLTTVSSAVYTMFALLGAARLFDQEAILLGDRGRIWAPRRRRTVRGAVPSVGQALFWCGLAFLLLFYVSPLLQRQDTLLSLAVTPWVFLLGGSLLLASRFKVDFKQTFALRAPPLVFVALAIVIGTVAWPLLAVINEAIFAPPQAWVEAMKDQLPSAGSPWEWAGLVFLLAVSPAVGEEFLFRGFFFSSLRGRIKDRWVILVTDVVFGVFHVSVFRLFPTTVLGLILGVLIVKSGSIWVAVAFHFSNNASVVLSQLAFPSLEGQAFVPSTLLLVATAVFLSGLVLLAFVPARVIPASVANDHNGTVARPNVMRQPREPE